jgi:hypothetical protein
MPSIRPGSDVYTVMFTCIKANVVFVYDVSSEVFLFSFNFRDYTSLEGLYNNFTFEQAYLREPFVVKQTP